MNELKVLTKFTLKNEDPDKMVLYLEPEANEFNLEPGETVEIVFYGNVEPVSLNFGQDSYGNRGISIWPKDGDYEVFYKGKGLREMMNSRKQ